MTNKLLPIVWALGTAVLLCGSGCQSGAYGQFISVESDRQFDQVALKDDRPVLLQVYRNGCLRCVFLAGTLSDLSKEYGDRVGFYKIERDQAARVRYRYGVGSYPTVILFVSGQERARWVAEWDTSVYRKAIEAAFAELNGEAPDRPSSSSGSEGPPPVPVSRSLPGACSVGLRDGENDVNSPGLCSEY